MTGPAERARVVSQPDPASQPDLACPLRCPGCAGATAAGAYVRKTLAKMSHASSDLAVTLKAM